MNIILESLLEIEPQVIWQASDAFNPDERLPPYESFDCSDETAADLVHFSILAFVQQNDPEIDREKLFSEHFPQRDRQKMINLHESIDAVIGIEKITIYKRL